MKKLLNNKKNIICLGTLLLIILIVLLVVIFDKKEKQKEYKVDLPYKISDEVVELPGTVAIENDQIKSVHCYQRVCVINAIIYTSNNIGRVDYQIINKNTKKVSGYLKMNFGSNSLIIAYKDLKPDKYYSQSAGFVGIDLSNATDYTLEKLSKKEKKSIVKDS